MMAEPHDKATITVALATFNRREMLERAVRSVLDERRVPIKLQVHDNASSDGTEAYMRALVTQDPRVTYTRNPTNVGGHNNIVASLNAVGTTYYVPLADDDYLLPDFLFEAYGIMQNDAELGAAAFYAEVRDEAGRVINYWPNDIATMLEGRQQPSDHLRHWMTSSHYSQQAVLWRSTVLDYIGAPYFHTGMPSDVDFQAQVFAKFPAFVVKRPGGVFSSHSGQASHGLGLVDVPSWAKLFARLDRAVEKFQLFSNEEYVVLRSIMWRRMQESWRRPTKSPVSLATLARLAVSAGFRLGDWELAFYLAAEVRRQQVEAERMPVPGAFSPSPLGPDRTGKSIIGGHLDLALHTMQSLQNSMQREHALDTQVNAVVDSMKTLQDAALTVTADRNRLAAEVAALKAQIGRLEERGGQAAPGILPSETGNAFATAAARAG